MTTPAAPQKRTPRVLLAAASAVTATTLLVAAGGALVSGSPAALGALVGGAIVLGFFGFGAGFVGVAARLVPQGALLVALLTYTFQVVLVGLVFMLLRRSGALEETLAAEWIAGALIAGTFAWMGGQLVATVRTPIAPWEPSVPPSIPHREVGAR